MRAALSEKISKRTARVAVIGLGYVGLPLAVGFAKAGFSTLGIEISEEKVKAINEGYSHIEDVASSDLAPYVNSGRLRAVSSYEPLGECDAAFICVPTPYTVQRTPDLSYIIAATESLAAKLRAGQLVVLQSTTYPGTTTDIVRPILETRSGLSADKDYYLAFSPERIDPGNREWSAYNTPKVVGGLTPDATALAAALLRQMGAPVHEVSSPAAAELTKLLENTFRAVNIALVNEIAQLAERMDIDIWEVIEAAETKPFGFMPFRPGPGVGGHCIPIDPYYLLWKAREYDFYTRFIELAAETNEAMPYHVVDRLVVKALGTVGKALHGARVLVLGVAFKPNVSDPRNSPAGRIIELLQARGAEVRYHDPCVPTFQVGGNVFQKEIRSLQSQPLTVEELERCDVAVIVTGHRSVDYTQLLDHAAVVVDTCNATRDLVGRARVIRLGTSHLQNSKDHPMERQA